MKKLSLNTDWEMRHAEIGTATLGDLSGRPALPCAVPGAVQLPFVRAGLLGEPLEKDNMEKFRFVEEQDFWHSLTFEVSEDFIGDRVELIFEGVDVNADYYLNGTHIGHSENAFYPAVFDVTDGLSAGENTLTVRVNEGVRAAREAGKDLTYAKYSWNMEEPYRTYLRKPQFCYGWDWARRLSTCGIYKPVWLKSYEKAYFEDVYVKSTPRENSAVLEVECPVRVLRDGDYTVRCTVFTDARYEERRAVATASGAAAGTLTFTLSSPRLWWCAGSGEPYLYEVTTELLDKAGRVLDSATKRHGVRSLSLEQKPVGTAGDRTFTFILNGRPIYAKGANWVPVDQIIGRISEERYETLIANAVDMNMNMFRVWGGGFYESDAFLDGCDRAGMLVWHDFMFACGYYPDFDEDFVESVRREAEYQVRHKRGHACFVGWSGNNENYSMYEGHAKNLPEKFPFYGRHIYEDVLPPICAAFDPDRPYRVSSPFGGDCADDIREGDQHFWGTYHDFHELYGDFFRIADSKASFVSEFGMIAPMNLESLQKCCGADEAYPQSEKWRFHSNTGDNFETILSRYFGAEKPCESYDTARYILMGQAVQAEVIRYAFEKYRSEKFLCSGTLFWMYSDCFPTSGWCFVDYYFNKKPLYYYTKRAFAPFGVVLKGYNANSLAGMRDYAAHYEKNGAAVTVTLVNDTFCAETLDCTVQVMTLRGEQLRTVRFSAEVPENGILDAMVLDLSAEIASHGAERLAVVCTACRGGAAVAQNRLFPAPFGKLRLEKPEVRCKKTQTADGLVLEVTADAYVWLCHLPHEAGVSYDNNDFDLVPGEPVFVRVTGTDAARYSFSCLTMNDCL